jgi:cysteine desulfurase/selenocysteine lyase
MTSGKAVSMVLQADIVRLREDFPALHQMVNGHPLVYLDNAATTHKPRQVLDTLMQCYTGHYSNIHRGVHYLSRQATEAYEQVRVKVRDFIHARSENEIIFTRGTTESINLVASAFGNAFVREGDEILISAMEHHSNIVPWQLLCERKKARLKIIPMNQQGELLIDQLENLINEKTRLVSVVHISNSLGTVNPIREIISMAHQHQVPVLIDAAQSVLHEQVNVLEWDCDFLAFSSHKMFGPTGAGVLYGKMEWLSQLPPYQGGGDMIQSVSFERTTYQDPPYRFEAGTQSIADVIALGAAIDYLNALDLIALRQYEQELLEYASRRLSQLEGVKLIGTARQKAPVLSFIVEGIHPLDMGMYLDTQGIAVRTGHHCTEPVMKFFGLEGTLRASLLFYNTYEEIDRLVNAMKKGISLLRPV